MNSAILVGYGYMGERYLDNLLQLGVSPHGIGVVDRKPERLEKCHSVSPDVRTGTSIEEVCRQVRPTMGFVLTNTPQHLAGMEELMNCGIADVFVEKPLVTVEQYERTTQIVAANRGRLSVGYLINFSPALQHCLQLLSERRLRIASILSVWGKDRRGDTRPSMGDMEDEATHPLMTMLRAIGSQAPVRDIELESMSLRFDPFVDAQAQQAAHALDASFPLQPNSSTALEGRMITIANDAIPFSVHSSFTSPLGQVRTIVADAIPADPADDSRTSIQLDFDAKGSDTLRVKTRAKGKEPVRQVWKYPAGNKLRDQIAAFIQWCRGGERDPRLVTQEEALSIVKLHRDVLAKAHEIGQ